MPRILAIDWDRLEARALLMHVGPTGSSVVGAWTTSLAAENTPPTPRELGTRLVEVIGRAVSGKATTIVGVGRDQVQMVLLTLPPAPPEELPDLVRFQAERSFTSLGDDAALDFIPLAGDSTAPHQVLAAALSGIGIAEVQQLCEAVGVEPERITLRATAAASFVVRRMAVATSEVSLVVNRLTDEADLTVLVGDQVVLVRTVRLPVQGTTNGRERALAGEIRRTIAAVRQQLGEEQVGRVILCGISSEAGDATALAGDLGLAVEVFDVAENAPPGIAKSGVPPESLARFAAVMGMALDEADRRPPVVDFLNVRRRVETRKFTRQQALAATAGGLALLLVSLVLWQRSASFSREFAKVNLETARLQDQFKQEQLDRTIAEATSIERWLATDVNWLDEFDRLSVQWRPEPLDSTAFPVADDAVVTQLTAFRPPGNDATGGRIVVQAVARNPQVLATLEQRLRDKSHEISAGGGKQDRNVPGYAWSFPLTINVAADEAVAEVSP